MWPRHNTGLQFALVKGVTDENAQKLEVEERIKAVEERSARHLENAARKEIDAYQQRQIHAAVNGKPKNPLTFQLALKFDETASVAPSPVC